MLDVCAETNLTNLIIPNEGAYVNRKQRKVRTKSRFFGGL